MNPENNVFKPEYTEKEYEILSIIIERCRGYDNNKWVSLVYDKIGSAMYVGEVNNGQPANVRALIMLISEEEYIELCYKLINKDTRLNTKTFVHKEHLFNHITGNIYFLNLQVRSLCSPFIRPLPDLKDIEDKIFNYVIKYIRVSFSLNPSNWMAINKITTQSSGALYVKVRIIYEKGHDDVIMTMSFDSLDKINTVLQYPLHLNATRVDIPPDFTIEEFNKYVNSKTMTESNTDIMREGMRMKKLIETIISKCELMGKLYDNLTNPIYKIYAIKDVNRIGIHMNALGAYEHHYAFIENVPSSDFVKLYNKCYTIIEDGWHISTKGAIIECSWDGDNTSREMIPLSDIVQALKNDQKQLDDVQKSNLLNAIVEKIHGIHAHIPNEVLKEEIDKKLGKYHSFSDQYVATISSHYRYEYAVFRSTVIESVHKYFKDPTDDNCTKAVKLINDFSKYKDPLIERTHVKLGVFNKVRVLIINSGYKVTIRSNHMGYPCGECKISIADNIGSQTIVINDNAAAKGVIVHMGGETLAGINHEYHKLRTLAQELIEQFNKLGDHLPIDLYCRIIA